MKTDRELLELAARAAGFSGEFDENTGDIWRGVGTLSWNSLKYDGDALRLAVELQLGISIPPVADGRVEVVTFYGPIISIVEQPINDDRQSATRRAITRAAAQIQLNKEQDNGK